MTDCNATTHQRAAISGDIPADPAAMTAEQLRGMIEDCDGHLAELREESARVEAEKQRYSVELNRGASAG